MRAVAWCLFGFSFVVAAVAFGAMATPAVDSGLATVALAHHDGLTRRQIVDLVIAVVFIVIAAGAAATLTAGKHRDEAQPELELQPLVQPAARSAA
ncbi:hypothetical protein [Leifsonia sp. NPDC080035]|uniref:Uncharacterized protein n=1 Tax=Leifsonia sp. NPDC080035 TaxID=3143936 RepID=A0AAU7G9C7_9MICO